MFTQQCYIKKNSKELREKLIQIGRNLNHGKVWGTYLVCFRTEDTNEDLFVASPESDLKNAPGFHSMIDCGTNEDLFLALAALRDDTDENQWFVLNTNVSMASENFKPKGTFIRCDRKSWFRDLNEDGTPDLFSSQNIPAHKASVQELINHFKK